MRIIRAFKWCKRYDLQQIEIDYNLNNDKVIIYKASQIKHIKHMIEVIKWAKQFPEYKEFFHKCLIIYIWKWLVYNIWKKNKMVDFLIFDK